MRLLAGSDLRVKACAPALTLAARCAVCCVRCAVLQAVFGLERLVDSTIAAKVPSIAYGTTIAIRFVNNVIGACGWLAGPGVGQGWGAARCEKVNCISKHACKHGAG